MDGGAEKYIDFVTCIILSDTPVSMKIFWKQEDLLMV